MVNNISHWEDFERVAKIGLEAIGYQVKRDVLIAGSQVDLYAEKTEPLHVHRLIVECKCYNKPIGIDRVRNFSGLVNALIKEGKHVSGLIISNKGFTKSAIVFAQVDNLKSITLNELLSYSFKPNEISSHIIDNYTENELSKKYIDLSCQVTESRGSTIYKPVEKFFDDFFKKTKRPGIALLGNFGSGKTSLCLHYAYLLAERWELPHEFSRFLPIYINLRDFGDFLDLNESLYKLLRHTYKSSLTREGLDYWLTNKRTMLFLDGFDEMASKMDKLSINQNISSLINFCEVTKVKIILSCRTHFLKNQVEEDLLGTTLKLYICNWGKEELIEYVGKSSPEKSVESLRVIHETYNLEELSKTPIFLNMIMESIDNIRGRVSISKLYEVYTDRWINSQDYRASLSPEDKMIFMEVLAFEMFINGKGKIKHEILPTYLKEHFQVRDYNVLKSIDKDIRTCSFLVRDLKGLYYFVHKSYMEFFVAKKLAKEVKSNNYSSLEKVSIPQEIAAFFSDYFEEEKRVLIRSLIGKESVNVRANCALAIGFFDYRKEHYDALSLCINTDQSLPVKFNAIDSLSKWNNTDSLSFLIKIASNDNVLSVHALKSLSSHIDNINVCEFFIDIISSPTDMDKVKIVLEIVEQVEEPIFNEVLVEFTKRKSWSSNIDIAKALVKAIPSKNHLELALELDNIERYLSSTINKDQKGELSAFVHAAKSEAIFKYNAEIKHNAIANKNKGFIYSKNEGQLRRKFKFLVTHDFIKSILRSLYGATISEKDKSKIKQSMIEERKRKRKKSS